ncbi:MAG TPA: hypothetical protein VIH90_05315 [Candidatus Saccharimonadales bacterium]
MSKKYVRPADFILPLNINGLEGRMINIEGDSKSKKNEILVIYDLNSNLERWWGLVVGLRRYANVTMADLPGFGGMGSFYTIGSKPTLDNLADYMASLVKLRYKRKRLNVIAIGFGFVVATRMLHRNPELKSKVKMIICINGYAHSEDLDHGGNKLISTIGYKLGSTTLVSWVIKLLANNRLVLNIKYGENTKKMTKQKAIDSSFLTKFKVDLKRETDVRSMNLIKLQLLSLDNCNARITNKLWHITYGTNKELDSKLIEQHLKVIFTDYNFQASKITRKIPFVMNDEKLAIKLLPAKLRRDLKKT